MNLMKRIGIIFLSITILSSIAFYILGKAIVEQVSLGELERGPGRINSSITKIKGEVKKAGSKANEYAEYSQIRGRIEKKGTIKNVESIIDIKEKAKLEPISNMYILEDFSIIEIIKNNKNIDPSEMNIILDKLKSYMEEHGDTNSNYFSGVITGRDMPYIVGVKSFENNDKVNFVLTIEKIDAHFIKYIGDETGRVIDIVKFSSIDESIRSEFIEVNLYNRKYFCYKSESNLDVYVKLETGNEEESNYMIKLTDNRAVRTSAERSVYSLVAIIILLTIILNSITYLIIRKNVINRILNINNAINSVKEGNELDIQLIEDKRGDEISELNKDFNAMFSRLKIYSDNLEFMGKHDTLTKLKNRYSITNYIRRLCDKKEEFAIFFIDLDNFKVINDTLGHSVGDNLLVNVSNELMNLSLEDSKLEVGRFGGDEFIIVRKGENLVEEIMLTANKVLKSVNKVYQFNSCFYEIKASMGISFFPQHSMDEGELLQYSDIAMYYSKKNGGNSYYIFEDYMSEPLKIERYLKTAIENDELEIYLQPIYSLNKNKIGGSEALIRWNRGGRLISPDKFIPLAKRTGDIVTIDNFVFRSAVKTCRELLDKGEENFYISINSSNLFLKQSNLISLIIDELVANDVDSKYIKIEVTEDEIIEDFDYTINLLNKLRELGIEIYLDDFGVGYSSFSHIKVLPIDVIKIDRSLLMDIANNDKAKQIINTMIILAHNLNIGIICEGVEDKEQIEILRELSCDNIQGYYFSKPLPVPSFKNFLEGKPTIE